MNDLNLHRVAKIETSSRSFNSHGGFKVKQLVITDEDGVKFEITLFSTNKEALKIKKAKIIYKNL